MPYVVPATLISRASLEDYLGRTISAADQDSADAAVNAATAMVNAFLGFDVVDADLVDGTDLAVCSGVAVRCAAQWFTNPQDRQSFSGPEGLAFTASPQMLSQIMSAADRATLLGVQLKQAPGFA
jgi:hypothetical protein